MERRFGQRHGKRQTNDVVRLDKIHSKAHCAMVCSVGPQACMGFNFKFGPSLVCELSPMPWDAPTANLVIDANWDHYIIIPWDNEISHIENYVMMPIWSLWSPPVSLVSVIDADTKYSDIYYMNDESRYDSISYDMILHSVRWFYSVYHAVQYYDFISALTRFATDIQHTKQFAHNWNVPCCQCTEICKNDIYMPVPGVSTPVKNRSCSESTRCCNGCEIPYG